MEEKEGLEDEFCRDLLGTLLESAGLVRKRIEVPVDNKEIPLWSLPGDIPASVYEYLGFLGKMLCFPNTGLLVKTFWHCPDPDDIFLNSQGDIISLMLRSPFREILRNEEELEEEKLPFMWIIAAEVTDSLLEGFAAKPELPTWGEGVYFFPPAFRTGVVALDRLPVNRETLWLRLLGNEETQQQAIAELMELPPESGELAIKDLTIIRFGKMDKPVERAIASLQQLPLVEALRLLVRLEREELLARFSET